MKKLKVNEIMPCGVNLTVAIKTTEKELNGVNLGKQLASKTNVEFYMGEVKSLGKDATRFDQCPGLDIGDFVMFNQFSGAAVHTQDEYTKVIRGYDVVAISKVEDMNKDTILPAGDRILIEILNESNNINGLEVEENLDARDKQTQKGVVLRLGFKFDDEIKVGDIVYIDPYDGNLIINDSELKLKTITYNQVLFKI